ncbi:NUDIX domain-containing protein [Leptolyngbya sp. FACHB-261]|uniref:NUDIX domain-containing protein n=1 Tax=Leptolyngbya sp. FACHB-261 TaxID=2692806 RepID=UPI0016854429|nr:NUDIX hydrolase [Leptolyngbya sp. FACHB-261]MBD2101562.1 NUDIX hydrolase [Leptolyngbya sp. FACHB-261]
MRRLIQIFQTVLGLILRHPVTGTSIIAVLPDQRIVLVRRTDNKRWALPGGIVDWGETLESTVKRELQEETGLKTLGSPRLVGVYSSPQRDPRMHSICVVVEVAADGVMSVGDELEISEVRAFSRAELPVSGLSHDHDQQLQNYFEGLTVLA